MYRYTPRGVCSRAIDIDLDGDKVARVEFVGGCDGNLKAVSKLIEGMTVEDVAAALEGNTCGRRANFVRRPAGERAARGASSGRVGPDRSALAEHGGEVPSLSRAFGAVGVAHEQAALFVDACEHDEVARAVNRPVPRWQMTGEPDRRARRTFCSSAALLRRRGQARPRLRSWNVQAVPSGVAHPRRSENAPMSAGVMSVRPVNATYAMAKHVGPQPVVPKSSSA